MITEHSVPVGDPPGRHIALPGVRLWVTDTGGHGTPLVLLSGQQARSLVTLEGQLTNVDAINLPKPLVKGSFEAPSAAMVPSTLARAIHLAATAPTGPVFVSVPRDDWRGEAGEDVDGLLGRRVAAHPAPQAEAVAPEATIA